MNVDQSDVSLLMMMMMMMEISWQKWGSHATFGARSVVLNVSLKIYTDSANLSMVNSQFVVAGSLALLSKA